MKVTDLKSHIVAFPIKKSTYVSSSDEELWRIAIVVQVFTDEGVVGLGGSGSTGRC